LLFFGKKGVAIRVAKRREFQFGDVPAVREKKKTQTRVIIAP
jgi:hypothetical protein